MDGINLRLCPWASRLTVDCSGVHVFTITVELLWTVFDKLSPLPTHPLSYAGATGDAHLQKMT